MANLHLALSHHCRIGTLGAGSSLSEARKHTLRSPPSRQVQLNRRVKIVANSACGSPDNRFTENKEPKASWWDTTPLDHLRKYVETLLPPTPYRHHTAAIYLNRVGIFWLTAFPVLGWLCPWLPYNFFEFYFFAAGVAHLFFWFNRFCAWRIERRERKMWEEKYSH